MAILTPWGEAVREHYTTEDSRAIDDISRLFSIAPTGALMSKITGLQRASLSDTLAGKIAKSSRHAHLQIVGQLVRATVEWQRALGGTEPLDSAWLENATLHTSRGKKTPLAVLSDTTLAREALDQLQGALVRS